MLSLMLAGGAVTRVVSGFVADYIGGVRTLLIGSLLQGMACYSIFRSTDLSLLCYLADVWSGARRYRSQLRHHRP